LIYNLVELVDDDDQFEEFVYNILSETEIVCLMKSVTKFIRTLEKDVAGNLRTELTRLRIVVQEERRLIEKLTDDKSEMAI